MFHPIRWVKEKIKETDKATQIAEKFLEKPRPFYYPTPEELQQHLEEQGIDPSIAAGVVAECKRHGEVRDKD